VSGILPVSLQDILYCWKSDLQKQKIIFCKWAVKKFFEGSPALNFFNLKCDKAGGRQIGKDGSYV